MLGWPGDAAPDCALLAVAEAGGVVGADGVDRAVGDGLPQCLTILRGSERGVLFAVCADG